MARYNTYNDDSHLPPEHRRIKRKVPASPWIPPKKEEKSFEEVASEPEAIITPIENTIPQEEEEDPVEIHQDAVVFTRGVLSEAISKGASDIHFEPKRESYQVRFRIDGVLHKIEERPIDEYQKILNSVKVLGDMDIAEHAVPQDGHIELVQEETETPEGAESSDSTENKGHFYDIRVSVFPSVNGEVVVMRILNRANALLTIEELGMDSESLEKLHDVLLTSYGMILITGPTGAGKTTTLYSVLSELKDDEKNIITLEDPIEFHLDWLRQCEIRVERDFTFERAMESVLRQDPDILMVGEIRDPHTAEHAVRSALVGRIVGSTIHANTTIGTIARLIELGISRSIVGHTLNAIIAQRLVRKICEHCKVPYTPDPKILRHFKLSENKGPYFKGKGCDKCDDTGYKGRTGIFSLMTFDADIRNHLFDQRPLVEIHDLALKKGMKTLRQDAATKILAGIITAEEASRVI